MGYIGAKATIPTKQEILLFDQIYMSETYLKGRSKSMPNEYADIVYLHEQGLIEIFPEEVQFLSAMRLENQEAMNLFANSNVPFKPKNMKEGRRLIAQSLEFLTRSLAIMVEKNYQVETVSILSASPSLSMPHTPKTQVVRLLLKNLPTPADDVPWEQITDFKKDPDSRNKFLNLRRWMRKVVQENLTLPELEEELDYLLNDYSTHLEIHKMKKHQSSVQAMFTVPLGLVENLLKLNFTKGAESAFTAKRERIQLMEEELSLPSREVAYIVHAQEHFGR